MFRSNPMKAVQAGIAFAWLIAAATAIGAEISVKPFQGGRSNILLITGVIAQSDSSNLAIAMATVPNVIGIELNSPGGDVVEAIQMGELVKATRFGTSVPAFGKCASACFIVWLNGSTRLASSDPQFLGQLGLHRPSLRRPENTEQSLQVQAKLQRTMSAYLQSKLVQQKFIDLMMTRPSNMLYWMTDSDLKELGTSPPELEELYIAKCGADMRQTIEQRKTALLSLDREKIQQMDDRMSKIMDCEARVDIGVRTETLARLRAGWRPSLPAEFSR
jgi:hypothetical protein